MPGVVVNRVEFVEHFPETRFDKILPAILLMGRQIRNGEGLVAFGEKYATTSSGCFAHSFLSLSVDNLLAPKITVVFYA